MGRLLSVLFILFALSACNSKSGGTDSSVQINTGGIFNPISLSNNNVEIQPVHDLGEYLLGSPKQVYLFTIRNNSLYKIFDVGLTLEGDTTIGFKFNKDKAGLSVFPGYTGTCTGSLNPGGSCTVALQFETTIKGQYEQDITFNYVNLVEPASRPLKLIILAGNAASLVFDSDETNFSFGNKIGLAQLPVVEKEDGIIHDMSINVTNAGDLKARNIVLSMLQTCESALTKLCPVGQENAYSFTSNCPAILASGESCQATVNFFPRNKDLDPLAPNPEWKNIKFDSTLKYDYLSSLVGPNNTAALGASFSSVSTKIEADFQTSIDSLPFGPDEIPTVGNRLQKSVRINNKGFREGQLRFLVVEKDGANIGYCVRGAASLMDCYTDETFSTPLSLAAFPFYFKDRDECFATALTNGPDINVENGCQLDIYFQPSVTYLTGGSTIFKLHTEFDSHWLSKVSLVRNFLIESGGTYRAAARLVPSEIKLNGVALPSTSLEELNRIASFDLGRLGMLSPRTFKRKKLEITFTNVGESSAINLSAKDGWNIPIRKKEDPLTGEDLFPPGATKINSHYAAPKFSTDLCNEIAEGASCTISTMFAPILTNSNIENTRPYMFDHIDHGEPSQSYKSFFLNYNDGSLYSDLNRTDIPDNTPFTAQAQLKADLVAKGVIDEVDMSTLEVAGGPHPFSKVTKSYIIMTNIGSDMVRYFGYVGNTVFNATTGLSVIETDESDLAKISADHDSELVDDKPLKDCSTIVDFNYLPTDNCSIVQPKLVGRGVLNPDESCVLTIQRNFTTNQLTTNAGNAGPGHALSRLTVKAFMNKLSSWEFFNYEVSIRPEFNYFDNDLVNTKASPLDYLIPCVGTLQKTTIGSREIKFMKPARVVPHTPRPFSSAVLYRKGFVLPSFTYKSYLNGVATDKTQDSYNIAENWFYGPDNVKDPANSSNSEPDVVTASKSVSYYHPSIVPYDLSNYDYVIHLGTFPVGQKIESGFKLSSSALALDAIWKSSSSQLVFKPGDSLLSNQFATSTTILLNQVMKGRDIYFPFGGESYNVSVNFTGDMPGLFASEFTYNYQNGDYVDTIDNAVQISQKILILAEAVSDAPDIEVSYANYKVTTNGSTTPTISPSGPTGFVSSDFISYQAGAADTASSEVAIPFTGIKITTPAISDSYVRKHFRLRNVSTQTMSLFKVFGRNSSGAAKKQILPQDSMTTFCMGDKPSSLCQGTCGLLSSLAPGASCYFEVYYKPNKTSMSEDYTITANFQINNNQHFARNIALGFTPKDPATVYLVGKNTERITTISLKGIESYPFDFGTIREMTTDPQVFAFPEIQVKNDSTTRASLLKTYQQYFGVTQPPADSAYDYNGNNGNYTLIYAKGGSRIQIYATKPCLVGGNSAEDLALGENQKGFNKSTTPGCFLRVVLNANSHYQNILVSPNDAKTMEPNFVHLPYYDNERSCCKYLNLHFKGKLKPNGTIGSPDSALAYTSVKATSSGTVYFRWKVMRPKNSDLGAVTGYRVYWTTSPSVLVDPYTFSIPSANGLTSGYVDNFGEPNADGFFQMTHNGRTPKNFYYYRVVPIRNYTNYNYKQTFPDITNFPFSGLSGNNYLSGSNVPQLGVVIPPADMYYDHTAQMLIARSSIPTSSPSVLTFKQAQKACDSPATAKLRLFRSGAAIDYKQRLITQAAWNSILQNPAESTYNAYSISLWLDGTTQNIHTTLSNSYFVGYDPLSDSKFLTSTLTYYQKISRCQPTCMGEKAVGTVYHAPQYSGYESYLSDGYAYGTARCYVNLLAP